MTERYTLSITTETGEKSPEFYRILRDAKYYANIAMREDPTIKAVKITNSAGALVFACSMGNYATTVIENILRTCSADLREYADIKNGSMFEISLRRAITDAYFEGEDEGLAISEVVNKGLFKCPF